MSADQQGTREATQPGTAMPATAGTAAWPRSVTGPQAIERVRGFVSDELYPLLNLDEHFRQGTGLVVVQQIPQLLDYLRIAGDWCMGQSQSDPPASGGQTYPPGRPDR